VIAFHLPGLPGIATTPRVLGSGAGALEVVLPRLTPDDLLRQGAALLAARERGLAERPVAGVVRVIDRVAGRLLDPADPLRHALEAALPAATGYAPQMARLVLERMAADWRREPLERLLRAEFGDPGVLDGFRPGPAAGTRVTALGPRLAAHVFSGNVPGVAVTSLVRALLVKSASLAKTAWGEPLLPALFAQALAEEDAALGECLAVAYWPGEDEALGRAALQHAEAVVVYGGAEAVEEVRRRVPPQARLHLYGPRLSFAVVARESLATPALAREAATGAARDASLFDQQGCVSPHLVYVEQGGALTPRAWAATLAQAMGEVEAALPRGPLQAGAAAAIQQLRGETEFSPGGEVHAPAGTAWSVLYDDDPAFAASCLNRVVRVKPVADLAAVPGLVAGHAEVLQSVGVSAPAPRREALALALARLGASRVAPLGDMAWPPPGWHHDGHPPLRTLVRWCDLEG
jgi:hypothetical protein